MPGARKLLAMASLAMVVMVYEVAVTRLLSVVLWYHFAFVAISVAMLGLSGAGVWLSLAPRYSDRTRDIAHGAAMLVAGVSIPLSVVLIVKGRPAILALGLGQAGFLVALVAVMVVPMFALGVGICRLLVEAEGRTVGRMYAADLFGAMVGALSVVPLMEWVATPELLALLGLVPLAVRYLLGARGWAGPAFAVAIVVSVALGRPYGVGYSKLYDEQGVFEPVHEVWTSTARITVFDRPVFSPTPGVPWGWGYGERFMPSPTPVREMWIDQDGSAGMPVEQLAGDPQALGHLLYDVTSLGYQLRRPKRVCVIGAGGGRDLVTALSTGAEQVDAVEIHSAIHRLMGGPLAEFSGDIYGRPGVRAVESEGRSFLARSQDSYDLIQISLVDSWAATAAGAFALSENYLYTVEALQLYLQRLAPGGVISISRWTDRIQPFESVRLILMAEEALRRNGVQRPREHLLFASGGYVGTLLIGARPFDATAVAALDRIAAERGFFRHFPPDPRSRQRSFVTLAMVEGPGAFAKEGIDLTPPVDDRPFFFQAADILRPASPFVREQGDMNVAAVGTLRILAISLALLTALLVLLPLVLARRFPGRGRGTWMGSLYFVAVGAAFMLLELPFLHRAVLLVGHPSHAAALTIGALLLGAGAGSAVTERLRPDLLPRVLWAVPVICAGVALLIEPLFERALGQPLAVRVPLGALTFAVPGLVMGLVVPAGFLRFGDAHKTWFWGLNGAASVLASVACMVSSIAFGFRATTLLGCALYALACLCLSLTSRPNRPITR